MRHALGPLCALPFWKPPAGTSATPASPCRSLTCSVGPHHHQPYAPQAAKATKFETACQPKDGKPATHYGLGIQCRTRNGHRRFEHSGEVGGFVAENIVYPDDKVAIAVLTNQEASSAAGDIAKAILTLFAGKKSGTPAATKPEEAQVKAILTAFQNGRIERALFTPDANFYFSAETLGDFYLQPQASGRRHQRQGAG